MSTFGKWVLIGLLTLFLGLLSFLLYQQEWEEIEVVSGLSQNARKDPLMVINMLLEQHQSEIQRKSSMLDVFDQKQINVDSGSTGLLVDERSLRQFDSAEFAVLEWVDRGGELIYLVSDVREKASEELLLETLSMSVLESDTRYAQHRQLNDDPTTNAYFLNESGDSVLKLFLPYSYYLQGCDTDSWSVVNKTLEPLICRVSYGQGSVTFAVTLDFIGNHGVFAQQNASLAVWLLSQKASYIYIGEVSSLNLFSSLWGWSALFVVTSGLLLILLVWHLMSRFGPALTPQFQNYNHFGLHIQALGRFYSQHHFDNKLQNAIREDIESRMEKFTVSFRQLGNEKKSELIHEKSGLNEQVISLLFDEFLPRDLHVRTQYVKSMQKLRKIL